MSTTRKVGYAMLTIGALVTVTAIAFAYVAIWTHGPNCNRFGGTAALSGLIGSPLLFLGAIMSDPES